MFILLLVELLKVGGVLAFTVGGHLVPHLSLLPCLETNESKKKEKDTHTQTQVKYEHLRSALETSESPD